jgi:hypothetical protein
MKKIIISIFLILLPTLGIAKKHYFGPRSVHYSYSLINEYIKQLNSLDDNQKYYLELVYKTCVKYDLTNTCVAIAWEESFFNKWAIVTDTGDYGLMGINLHWFLVDNNIKENRYTRAQWDTKLVKDDLFNIMYSVAKLQKLKNRYKSWKSVWAHYNGGSNPNWYYAYRILNKIYAFRRWLKGR